MISPLTDRNFSRKRQPNEGMREYVSSFMDESHYPIIDKLRDKYELTSEQAAYYAIAMFSAIEDLMFSHYEFEIGEFKVNIIDNGTVFNAQKKIDKYKSLYGKPNTSRQGKGIAEVKESLLKLKPIQLQKTIITDYKGLKEQKKLIKHIQKVNKKVNSQPQKRTDFKYNLRKKRREFYREALSN